MTTQETTDLTELAARFVNSTSQHIFLTGKAGTGKTTFLRAMAEKTHKSFVIVAPTGIAALNAKGVTIHSQFLLPPGTFLPDRSLSDEQNYDQYIFSPYSLTRKHPLSAARRQVLRAIDLLIIDEVSMLRADLLDAIDFRMRSVKRNHRVSFGGVQVLMIGDLYQLPPVVREQEWNHLKKYYDTPHFFSSRALKESGFAYIELDKIYRQSDEQFIRLLNNLRNNVTTAEDIELLNAHFRSEESLRDEKEIITITTHNYRADELNQQTLKQLPGKPRIFEATIEGEFPENLYPLPFSITLKIGTQIMFVKNDTIGGNYFNGKLAEVTEFTDDGDIVVTMAGDHQRYVLQQEEWENKKYTINSLTRELDEEVVGTFRHFPIKLAWAITVHKSQGLTFDRAIIDVGKAFAPGQVYVALSRLRSLDGLILRTRISPEVIATDTQVVEFSRQKVEQTDLGQELREKQLEFLRLTLLHSFDFEEILKEIENIKKNNPATGEFQEESMRPVLDVIREKMEAEKNNTQRFRNQLQQILQDKDTSSLLDRIRKGVQYYDNLLRDLLPMLLRHIEEMKRAKRVKGYLTELAELDLLLTRKRDELGKTAYLAECILEGKEIENRKSDSDRRQQERLDLLTRVRNEVESRPVVHSGRTSKKTVGKKAVKKGSTYEETYALIRSGLDIAASARQRGLTESTIEGHVVKGIRSGEIDILKVMSAERRDVIAQAFRTHPDFTITQVFLFLKEAYSYNTLRMVQNWMLRQQEMANES